MINLDASLDRRAGVAAATLDRLPRSWRPYARLARLDRPIGTWLLLLPCWWSLALAGSRAPGLYALFGVGAVVMRGAGCTVNDILDRDIDRQVARTATRPLPAGDVTLRRALAFLAAQLLVGLAVLVSLNAPSIRLGVASLALVFAYPLMKRVTWWPQLVLGLAFNWGALMGWTAARGALNGPAILLYAAGIAWTLGYDTIYALQDVEDDARIGVKSTARLFGAGARRWIGGFYAVMLAFLLAAGYAAGAGLWFTLTVLAAALALAWQVATLEPDHPRNCLARFTANRWVGWIVLAGMLGDVAGR